MPATAWSVLLRPVDVKSGTVESGGLAVILTNGDEERETVRIAFDRKISKHPGVSFDAVMADEIAKAETAIEKINDLEDEFDRLQAEATDRAKQAIKEALGRPPVWNAKPA